MTATEYVLPRTDDEYERLRRQARMFEPETARLLDRIGVPVGARCLDAGCGPGETMRLLAERVGRHGLVFGVDADRAIGEQAVAALHARGHRQCEFEPLDLETADVPGGPYDVVFVRLLLLHVHEPVEVLRRLWDRVTPGGVLVVQEHDLLSGDVVPELETVATLKRVVTDTFQAAGRELRAGPGLPALFAAAGIGAPDGLDAVVRAGLLPELAPMYEAIFAAILPAALALGVTTEQEGAGWFDAFARDSGAGASAHGALWPTLVGGWRRKRFSP